MSAIILDGKAIAADIMADLKSEVTRLQRLSCEPQLVVILVGDDPASQVYVGRKEKGCAEIGIQSQTIRMDAGISEEDLLRQLQDLNQRADVHGILVQLPLPRHISTDKILTAIDPKKDVDGFHPVNRGKLMAGETCLMPCTPAGVQEILKRSGINPEGKHVVVVGRSMIVGMPFAVMMMQKKPWANATVTLCHTGTRDLGAYTKRADILVVAAGRPKTITAEMVTPGTVVIDVGTNRVDAPETTRGYRLTGDVEFDSVSQIAGAITPVPGGVGPMTIVMLLKNTLQAAEAFILQ